MLSYQIQDEASGNALIALCKSGDRGAWDALIRGSEQALYRMAYSFCHNYEEAGDIVGQVFLHLYRSLHTFRNEASFQAWLYSIVRHAYLDQCVRPLHRRDLRLNANPTLSHPFAPRETLDPVEIMDPAPSPEAVAIEKERRRLLDWAIRHLPASRRQILQMYHIEEKPYEEIARLLGVSIGTVKSRLNRARVLLRERMSEIQ